MADNIAVTPGSGATIAADEIAAALHQRVKITIGADGVNDGDVSSANPLPVSASTLPLPTGASTAAKQPALGTAGTASSDVITVQGITSMTALKVDGSAVTQPVSGNIASGATDSGNPVKVGGLAKTTMPTSVTDGQRVDALFTKSGKLVTVHALRELNGNQATTITASTAETTIVTATASVMNDLYALILTNSSATATVVTVKDSTGGTTRMTFAVPAASTVGFITTESAAHKQAAVNTNWTATSSASITSLLITAMFTQNS
jgi:hypothetical protein